MYTCNKTGTSSFWEKYNVSLSKCQKRVSKRYCKFISLLLFRLLWEKVWTLCLFYISCCCFLSQVTGPMILQVQKLRNISAPKANEESIHAPRLLKIQLTDGHLTCHGLENSSIPDLRYESMHCSVQSNLDLMECQGTGKIYLLYRTAPRNKFSGKLPKCLLYRGINCNNISVPSYTYNWSYCTRNSRTGKQKCLKLPYT